MDLETDQAEHEPFLAKSQRERHDRMTTTESHTEWAKRANEGGKALAEHIAAQLAGRRQLTRDLGRAMSGAAQQTDSESEQ